MAGVGEPIVYLTRFSRGFGPEGPAEAKVGHRQAPGTGVRPEAWQGMTPSRTLLHQCGADPLDPGATQAQHLLKLLSGSGNGMS